MGQAIVYCSKCNAQLRSTDFAKGTAVKLEHKTYCRNCLPDGVVPPPIEKPAPESSSKKRGHHTTSISVQPPRPAEAPKPVLVWVAGLATGIVLVIAGFVLFSPPGAPRASVSDPAADAPRSSSPAPALSTPERDARETLARLLRKIQEQPDDLDGQQALLDDLAARAPGTSVAGDVPLEKDRLARRRDDFRKAELGALELEIRDSTAEQSRILLNAARTRHPDAAWTVAVDKLLKTLEPETTAAIRPTTPPPPAAPPKPVPPPPAPKFPPGWESAMRSATARDYAAALAALDASPDAALVKAVGALQAEALKILGRTPRGQKVAIDAAGGRHVEGAFLRENGGIFEIKEDAATAEVDAGDLTAASMVAVARAAGPVDPRTAAALCLIEGETEAARTILVAEKSALPERFWLYAAEISHGPTEPSREQYLEALASLSKPATSADGVARLQLLLKDRAGDLFVRRNRAAITTRSQGGRDFVWFAEDLKSSGVFHLAKGSKLESCWTNESDVEGPKAKENFLEVEFSTLPDIPYKAWALIGGCCQEVLEFSCQGTEMEAGKGAKESAEPGSAAAVPVKPWMSSLKKTHSQHNGPKAPARWDWTPLPLPRYTRTGLQRLRLLSDQKGFSVAAVVVSAARTAPPSDAELRDLLRLRGDRPKAPPPPKAVVLAACKFDGSDRFLVGELKDKALHGVPLFGQLFTGYEGLQLVTMTENGEIRFTYFVKSPTKLTVRIRVERDGGTIPCDLPVPNVVVGTPTEVRIRFTDFKPAYTPGPNIAPGETAHMFHIFAAATDSALRIDAFSLVEIRK